MLTDKQKESFFKIIDEIYLNACMECGESWNLIIPKNSRPYGVRGKAKQIVSESMLKHLEEYELITVVTVSESAWKYSREESKGTYFRVGLTPKGLDFKNGKIEESEIEKPCTEPVEGDTSYWYTPVCPRHGVRHERISKS